MGKISPTAAKYIIKAELKAKGIVEKPDVIGAIFGQTEGLLGPDLELRELQKSGRIGRIEVELETKNGKTTGIIEVPSSMDKAETAIVAAALETIERIGPCEAEIKVLEIQDVRETKRKYIVERAKELLREMIARGPDTQELVEDVAQAVRMAELVEYGPEKLPAGPAIETSDEIIVVEGRADVLNLLKHGIKNVIAIGGTKIPKTIIELTKKKTTTLFVDGDRGGDLIIKEMLMVADVDYIARAPPGKEVEELSKKEIHKALRAKQSVEQLGLKKKEEEEQEEVEEKREERKERKHYVSEEKKEFFRKLLEEVSGSRSAFIIKGEEILGKVPINELGRYLEALEADTLVIDGLVTKKLFNLARRHGISTIVGKRKEPGVNAITADELE